jgi:hypothetical protein
MNMKSRVCNSSSNSSRLPRLHQRLQRASPAGRNIARRVIFTPHYRKHRAIQPAFMRTEAVPRRAAAPNAAGFATGTAASARNPSSGCCSRVGRARHVQSVTIEQCRRGFHGLGTDERAAGFRQQTHGGIVDGNEAAQVQGCDPGLLLCEASFVP